MLMSNVNQINLNQTNQFLELSNMMTGVRNQNVQLLAALETAKDVILTRLNTLLAEITDSLPDLTSMLDKLAEQLLDAINTVQQTLRNELNNTNSILTNLASSVTNINGTLNNLLAAIENLVGGGGGGNFNEADRQKLDLVYTLVNEIKNILTGTLTKK
jgi:ABC-type transporter Mla subunit MlaD